MIDEYIAGQPTGNREVPLLNIRNNLRKEKRHMYKIFKKILNKLTGAFSIRVCTNKKCKCACH